MGRANSLFSPTWGETEMLYCLLTGRLFQVFPCAIQPIIYLRAGGGRGGAGSAATTDKLSRSETAVSNKHYSALWHLRSDKDGSLPTLAPLSGDGLQTWGTLIAPLSDAHHLSTTVFVRPSVCFFFLLNHWAASPPCLFSHSCIIISCPNCTRLLQRVTG